MIVSHVVPPEELMFIRLMQAHSQNGDLDRAEDVLIHMARAGMVVGQPVYTTLLQAYAEIGDLEGAEDVLTRMKEVNPTITHLYITAKT